MRGSDSDSGNAAKGQADAQKPKKQKQPRLASAISGVLAYAYLYFPAATTFHVVILYVKFTYRANLLHA